MPTGRRAPIGSYRRGRAAASRSCQEVGAVVGVGYRFSPGASRWTPSDGATMLRWIGEILARGSFKYTSEAAAQSVADLVRINATAATFYDYAKAA
jgi:hypothetical protein